MQTKYPSHDSDKEYFFPETHHFALQKAGKTDMNCSSDHSLYNEMYRAITSFDETETSIRRKMEDLDGTKWMELGRNKNMSLDSVMAAPLTNINFSSKRSKVGHSPATG